MPDHVWYSFSSRPVISQHFLPISKFIVFMKYQRNSVQTESVPVFFVKVALNDTKPENSSELKHRVLCEKINQVLQYILSKYKQLILECVAPDLKGSCLIFSKYMLVFCNR